jgi:hypothetical protein
LGVGGQQIVLGREGGNIVVESQTHGEHLMLRSSELSGPERPSRL